MRALSITGLFLIAFIFSSCSDDDSQTPDNLTLEETTWRLVRFELTGRNIPAADGQDLTLRLGMEIDGQRIAQATADCNQCGCLYTLGPDDSISVPLACTEMYCGDASQGGLFAEMINRATTYSQSNTSLSLTYSSEEESGRLIFAAETE
jgi:hypothetical protein